MSKRHRVELNVNVLQHELHRQQPGRKHDADQVIRKHARLTTKGRSMRCTASRAARASGDPLEAHSLGKVIFDTADAARACRAELRELYPDDEPTYVYECRRSKHGHVHLTTKWRADNLPEPDEEVGS